MLLGNEHITCRMTLEPSRISKVNYTFLMQPGEYIPTIDIGDQHCLGTSRCATQFEHFH